MKPYRQRFALPSNVYFGNFVFIDASIATLIYYLLTSSNMKKHMKGQGAMEYLMTYGWALLVIVVVGGALFALGVLNPSTYTQKRCQGFQYFSYQDQRINSTGVIIDLLNGPRQVTVTAMTVNGVAATNVVSIAASPTGGARFTVSGDVAGLPASGTSYTNYPVTLTYDVTGGISGNVDRGTCSGTAA